VSTEDKINAFRGEHLVNEESAFDSAVSLGESPIERLFLAAVVCQGAELSNTAAADAHEYARRVPRCGLGRKGVGYVLTNHDEVFVWLVQPWITSGERRFRVDLALIPRAAFQQDHIRFVVELDGHDFHEKTKEQARRDKARDRELSSLGWRVLRFTGSEVFADAGKCMREAGDAMWAAMLEEHGRQGAQAKSSAKEATTP
jgi:hypothetical protein